MSHFVTNTDAPSSAPQYKIPKILHQLWIGDQSKRPALLMETWKKMHPDWEYIAWDEAELEKRGVVLECQQQIKDIPEINGKADIIRWNILYQYGGVFEDADSICLDSLDPDIFLTKNGFSCYENEDTRKGLVCCGSMGFPPKHPLLRDILDSISKLDLRPEVCNLKAWVTCACVLETNLLNTGNYPDFTVFPSHMFIPHHFSGPRYQGHKRVYAYQAWGSTYKSYQVLNGIAIPPDLLPPPEDKWVSVLISSYNTPEKYIQECLDSIRMQTGHFGMQIVWVNDGSDQAHTDSLRKQLSVFEKTSRFCKVKYHELSENMGIAVALHEGVKICDHSLIIKMDSDDIMRPHRIATQIGFMEKNPGAVICGANIQFFRAVDNGNKNYLNQTSHPAVVEYESYRRNPVAWFFNHPPMCVRKAKLISAGNYNKSLTKTPFEDFEMELRMLKKYGKVYNIQDVLLNYRLHDGQVTHKMNADPGKWGDLRKKIIDTYSTGSAGGHKKKMGMNL